MMALLADDGSSLPMIAPPFWPMMALLADVGYSFLADDGSFLADDGLPCADDTPHRNVRHQLRPQRGSSRRRRTPYD